MADEQTNTTADSIKEGVQDVKRSIDLSSEAFKQSALTLNKASGDLILKISKDIKKYEKVGTSLDDIQKDARKTILASEATRNMTAEAANRYADSVINNALELSASGVALENAFKNMGLKVTEEQSHMITTGVLREKEKKALTFLNDAWRKIGYSTDDLKKVLDPEVYKDFVDANLKPINSLKDFAKAIYETPIKEFGGDLGLLNRVLKGTLGTFGFWVTAIVTAAKTVDEYRVGTSKINLAYSQLTGNLKVTDGAFHGVGARVKDTSGEMIGLTALTKRLGWSFDDMAKMVSQIGGEYALNFEKVGKAADAVTVSQVMQKVAGLDNATALEFMSNMLIKSADPLKNVQQVWEEFNKIPDKQARTYGNITISQGEYIKMLNDLSKQTLQHGLSTNINRYLLDQHSFAIKKGTLGMSDAAQLFTGMLKKPTKELFGLIGSLAGFDEELNKIYQGGLEEFFVSQAKTGKDMVKAQEELAIRMVDAAMKKAGTDSKYLYAQVGAILTALGAMPAGLASLQEAGIIRTAIEARKRSGSIWGDIKNFLEKNKIDPEKIPNYKDQLDKLVGSTTPVMERLKNVIASEGIHTLGRKKERSEAETIARGSIKETGLEGFVIKAMASYITRATERAPKASHTTVMSGEPGLGYGGGIIKVEDVNAQKYNETNTRLYSKQEIANANKMFRDILVYNK